MRVGVYMDLTPRQFKHALPRLRPLFPSGGGVLDFVRVMADTPGGVSRVAPSEFGDMVASCIVLGAACAPVFWPRKTWNQERWAVARSLAALGTDDPVLDIEHQAKSQKTRRALAQNSFLHFPFRSVITTHAGHPEADDPSWPNNPYEMQAYSTADMVKAVGPKGLPGAWQARQALRKCNPRELALAIYDQEGLPTTPRANLTDALRAAVGANTTTTLIDGRRLERVCYWSLKHILRNKYAIPFLRDDAPRILGRTCQP